MKINSYSKIFAVGHRRISELFDGEVWVEEKVDGSQFSFGMIDGTFFCRSKGCDQTEGGDSLFFDGVEAARERISELKPNWVYRGEYFKKPKHNTIAYERMPHNHIMIFDIDTTGHTEYLTHEEKKAEAERLGFECVPLLFKGKIEDWEQFKGLIDTDSVLGGAKVEGIVIKNYDRWTDDGKTMMGKYVREDFKEKNSANWNKPGRKDVIELIIEEYRNENRWQKAVQHMRERGELINEPKDIGGLFKEVTTDIFEECSDEIKDKLFKSFWKSIAKGVTRGMPEWYKGQLAMSVFKEK